MARFDIISRDGNSVRHSGKPRYNGSYLKPSFLEFSEISVPSPIAWEVGDYVDYPRTGMRYRLYSIPQPSKNARKGSHGGAFTYSNVQFHAATKELEIALFRDLVANDNGIHFSTSPDVATFENVEGIARRIQACMDDFYPGRWVIRIADFDAVADAEIIEKISEAKDFALSGGTCLDALSKIYELWQDIGWIHTHEDGAEVITIGYANKRIAANTTDAYLYGKGNGLTAIKKSQTNKDEFATRLYVYGSDRNLPSRYYNGLDILNAESVDIRNLMLPLDRWGLTDGLPDARKAYLENADAVAKFGVIPKTHYFDSTDAGADIYPSIEGMTIGQIRNVLADMGINKYSPSTSIYPEDAERVDEIWGATRVLDDGVLKRDGKEHDMDYGWYLSAVTTPGTTIPKGTTEKTAVVENHLIKDLDTDSQGIIRAKITFTSDKTCTIADAGYESVSGVLTLANSLDSPTIKNEVGFTFVLNDEDVWEGRLPKVAADYDRQSYLKYVAIATMSVYVTPKKELESDITASVNISDGYVTFFADQIFDKTFTLTLKQIGFDINERAALGEGKVISMKTGSCAGRNFAISECRYVADVDKWSLVCKRQQDDTLGILFPNKDYQISTDDRFVLTDIAMPEQYIRVAMERLLAEGERLLARASKVQNHYEPAIDAKVMVESGRTLREGMFMEITDEDVVDNTTDYILIDTLSIYEDESAIPTYRVTLRERRKVTYKGTPSATATTSTKSVDDGSSAENGGNVDIDLSGYATTAYVNTKIAPFEDMFYFYDDNTIGTKYSFFSEQENSAGGVGEAIGTGGGGGDVDLTGYATEEWVESQGYAKATDIPTKVSALENDAEYVTKSQADGTYVIWTDEFVPLKNKVDSIDERVTVLEATGGTGSGDIDLTAYATKTWVVEQGYVTSEAIDGKQDTIEDLAAIREGASKGATAAQPADIPTKVSQLTNDRNYITTTAADGKYASYSDLAAYLKSTDIADWAKAASKPSYDYSEIGNTPDLTIYALASALNDYALKNDVYTQQQIAEILKSYVLTNDIAELVEWYENIGVKFIKDDDGAIKMDGDFYTTGENSAGGVGENVGTSGGGGLDESQLEDYLTENGYATQSWVTSQGYASSTSVDAKQDKITDLATIRAGAALGATALQGVPDGYVTETELDQKGYATTADLSGKVDKVTGKGLSTNDYTTAEKNKLAGLENYDDTEVKNGITANAAAITEVSNRVIPLEEWYDLVGQHFKYDETNEAWYLDGDFYATGENSAGGAGDELIDIAGLDTRVETLETKVEELQKTSGQNLAIDFQGLDSLIQLSGSITSAELAALGLTAAAIENMLNGQYNKIVHSGAKRQVWNYTAYEGDGTISIYLMQGDGFDIFNGYHLSYSSTTGYWSIVFGEI